MDYPNMSYCMCENTASALKQVLGAMYDEGSDFLSDANRYERDGFRYLVSLCEDFLEQAKQVNFKEKV